MNTQLLTSDEILLAIDLIKRGELVAFPTETVYGLGASIFNFEAMASIFKVKGRPPDNPLIAHAHSLAQIEEIAIEIPDLFYRLAEVFFPGPLAIILKKHPLVPGIASAGLDSIAVRIPLHPIALKLIEGVGTPLVAPSANLSGRPSATNPKHVMEDFEGKIAAVIDGGQAVVGIESTVISLLGAHPTLLRPGHITKEAIEEVIKAPVQIASDSRQGPVLSPGMKYRHYAPRTPIRVFDSLEALNAHLHSGTSKQMLLSRKSIPFLDHFDLSAKDFYSLLRQADEEDYDEILIFCDEGILQDAAIMNRLTKAAGISS